MSQIRTLLAGAAIVAAISVAPAAAGMKCLPEQPRPICQPANTGQVGWIAGPHPSRGPITEHTAPAVEVHLIPPAVVAAPASAVVGVPVVTG